MIEVIPSLPASSFAELERKLAMVRGLVSTFQIDVCDGMFVDAVSWPLHEADKEKFQKIVVGDEALPFWGDFDFEVDLMVDHPERLLPDLISAGISRALIHIESNHDFSLCRTIAEGTIELGVALSIGTPISEIDEYIEHITCVQLMGIEHIGRQGQPFDPRVLDAIAAVKERYPDVIIEVDGAVNKNTASRLVAAGAQRLAPGSFVFQSENPKEAVSYLKSLTP